MATDQQVVLTRIHKMPAPSPHISKAARQVVPAFLQKLYEMVNDPANAELIRWSDLGDSFFVLDHERFAHEVLGRWFKHRNFSSFVRQLNMYGFHKIPHLQQGVLKSDSDTEFWNFAHANFLRGQPDLLCLIQRKKQIPQPGDEGAIDLRDQNTGGGLLGAPIPPTAPNAPVGSATLSSGQILDIHSIINGISAIKRHQTTISAELNELKRSNQLLWQDSLAARAKHQKQQDTINRIVKFLAGVFGSHVGGGGAGGSSPSISGQQHEKEDVADAGMGTRRKMRLMIEDAKRDGPKRGMIEELTEIPLDMDYPTIETPISDPSPSPSVAMSDNITIADASSYYSNHNGDSLSSKSDISTTPVSADQQPQPQGKQISRAVTPSHHSPTSFEFDPRIHGVLNQLSPSQIQQLLTSLTSQSLSDSTTPASSSLAPNTTINPSATTTSALLTPYHQPSSFDFSINPASQTGQTSSYNPNIPIPLVSPEGLISFDHYDPGSPTTAATGTDINLSMAADSSTEQQEHEQRMDRQWRAAEDIDKDVNALNSSINMLIQTFGLDPSLLDKNMGAVPGNQHGDEDMHGGGQAAIGMHPTASPEFDFDSFFNNLSSSSSGMAVDHPDLHGSGSGNVHDGMDYSDLASSAFLHEVPTPSSSSLTASPVQPMRQVSPELNLGTTNYVGSSTGTAPSGPGAKNTAAGGRKRKSDVIMEFDGPAGGHPELVGSTATTTTTTKTGASKSKRRKDK